MSRRAPIDPNVQPALPIPEGTFDPASRDALRLAYDEAGYERHGIPFDEALDDKGLAIALKILAEVIGRRVHKHH